MPDFSLECAHNGLVCGIDEAGRGPLAGPVVSAAVIFPARHAPKGVDDSKRLKAAARERLFAQIMASAEVGVGMASVEEIDTHNILGATLLSMQRAFVALGVPAGLALVDGNRPPVLPCAVKTVVAGDAKSLSIAAASIIAKVTRDRIMQHIDKEHPGYGFARHMGYGTKIHLEALARLGITPHHRRSFAPVRAFTQKQDSFAA